ncbi:hypothetical protein AB834_04615 [PVC group bacterium (ex Bugula neritina AB1)]|nr:hypothetical protein AB834_04615 [PVC group bacterium (ex Bugula neritina AB1)]
MYSLLELPSLLSFDRENFSTLSADPLCVSIDSRTVKPKDVFIAIEGVRYDGHHFCEEAIQKGAAAIIISNKKYLTKKVPCFYVKNTMQTLMFLAHQFRKRFTGCVFAVTGSSGKTTVKELLRHVFSEEYPVLATNENFNNQIGVALFLLSLDNFYKIAVVEAGISQEGDMDELSWMIQPDSVVITHIHPSHIEGLGCIENIAKEKTKLLKFSKKGADFYFHKDEKLLQETAKNFDVSFKEVDWEKSSLIKGYLSDWPVFMKKNAALVGFIAQYKNIKIEKIGNSLRTFGGVGRRFMSEMIHKVRFIDDTYNSNPGSLREGLRALASMSAKRVIVCLGDMGELGESAKEWHESIWQDIVLLKPDRLILVGKIMPHLYREKFSSLFEKDTTRLARRVDQVIPLWNEQLFPGDIVYAKGSRAIQLDLWMDHVKNHWRKTKKDSSE